MSNQFSLFFREDDNLIFAKNLKEFIKPTAAEKIVDDILNN